MASSMALYWTLVNSVRESTASDDGSDGMPRIFGASGLVALTLSGVVSFAAVVGIAGIDREAAVPLWATAAARPWSRPPPPEVRPLDDSVTAEPVRMHEPQGTLIYPAGP